MRAGATRPIHFRFSRCGSQGFFEILFNAIAVHWDILRQDLRYTVRTLARSPGFAVTAILVVAIGIGANTAAFSVTDFVLIRNLPFPNPERLVKIWQTTSGYDQMEFSPLNYRDVKRMSKSFEAMGAFTGGAVNLVGQGDPQRIQGSEVTSDVIPLLGTQPSLGRLFTPEDERDGRGRDGAAELSVVADAVRGRPRSTGTEGDSGRPALCCDRRDAIAFQFSKRGR